MAYNILLVDDSSIIRKMLTKTLGLSGVPVKAVFEAENGQQALEVLDKTWIDVIFLDINMPVMNGIEFMHALRDHPEFIATPVIVISTEGSRVRKAELADMDVKAYLRKPVSPEQIADAVQTVLNVGR
ncbi:MAG: response regulator [Deltaproteobacteria bacterium]|nr:response regulator [Deltaproteobacteria bacterium]